MSLAEFGAPPREPVSLWYVGLGLALIAVAALGAWFRWPL